MANIKRSDLIAKFKEALNNHYGYIWGMVHTEWTAEKQAAYVKAYSGNSDRANSCKYGSKWVGHWVTDCSGLFTWAFQSLGGNMYHGSNTMYLSYCQHKGQLKNGKRTDGKELLPGTAVFVWNSKKQNYSHVGLYVGNGTVIEAMGAEHGVTTTKITNKKWTNWGELKGVSYEGGDTPVPEPTPEKGYAIVTGKNLALREGPSTNCRVITRAPTGSNVKIETPPKEWDYVDYNGRKGWMMREFLKEG